MYGDVKVKSLLRGRSLSKIYNLHVTLNCNQVAIEYMYMQCKPLFMIDHNDAATPKSMGIRTVHSFWVHDVKFRRHLMDRNLFWGCSNYFFWIFSNRPNAKWAFELHSGKKQPVRKMLGGRWVQNCTRLPPT